MHPDKNAAVTSFRTRADERGTNVRPIIPQTSYLCRYLIVVFIFKLMKALGSEAEIMGTSEFRKGRADPGPESLFTPIDDQSTHTTSPPSRISIAG